MDENKQNTNSPQQEVQVTDAELLARMIKKIEREETVKEESHIQDDELKHIQVENVHDWLNEATSTLSRNTYLEPTDNKNVVKLHVGVFEKSGEGVLTRTYIIKVKIVNDDDEYMIEKLNYDYRGLASSYHREIDSFKDLREYLLQELAREIVFVRNHEELAVFKYTEKSGE